MAHESAHGLIANWVGSSPVVVTSTGPQGDWRSLTEIELLLVGLAGIVANGLLALLGWLVFRAREALAGAVTTVAWLTFAVNAWILAVTATVTPALGVGDGLMVLENMPNAGLMRASAAAAGLMVCAQLLKGTAITLAQLVGNGREAVRRRRAWTITGTAWIGGGAIAIGAALRSPLGLDWSLPATLIGTLAATVPLMLASRKVGERPVPGRALSVPASPTLMVAAALAGALLILRFGPGFTM